ncbi:MAG TPA: D-alanyl-D-alanine dipeptidase [Spirochaetia bacterium]|nr:D-alanyl-D-alanine dipeptidase [Spirochaetales bacterium]HRW24467.1 D-alanyl-D-alanine dipeptidase [Spirochaetia bacterium]
MDRRGLVDVESLGAGIVVDMRYATSDNFIGTRLYDGRSAWLLAPAAAKLAVAARLAAADGRVLVVLDAYRPLAAQARMWAARPEPGFVAPPERGSNHNRGAAVDVTLADEAGRELAMPSAFDDFSERASHAYAGGPPEALANRDALRSYMERAGFVAYEAEWWHYNDPESRSAPLLDVPFAELEGR